MPLCLGLGGGRGTSRLSDFIRQELRKAPGHRPGLEPARGESKKQRAQLAEPQTVGFSSWFPLSHLLNLSVPRLFTCKPQTTVLVTGRHERPACETLNSTWFPTHAL